MIYIYLVYMHMCGVFVYVRVCVYICISYKGKQQFGQAGHVYVDNSDVPHLGI